MTRSEELEFIKNDVKDFYKNCRSDAEFEDYLEYAGWQPWMENYCDSEDDITESENKELIAIQKQGFQMYLDEEEEENNQYIMDCWDRLSGIKEWWNSNVKDEYKIVEDEETFKNYFIDDAVNQVLIEIPSFKTKSGHAEIFRY